MKAAPLRSSHAAGGNIHIRASGKTMSADDKKSKSTAAKKEPVAENRTAEPKTESNKTDSNKTDSNKTETGKTETIKAEGGKIESAPSNKGMGEGQKPVSQAYKDNWNAIFAKKKKR
jgi:heme-binding NEAT domain protein